MMMRVMSRSIVMVFVIILLLIPFQASLADDALIDNGYCEIVGNEVRYTFELSVWDMRGEDIIVRVFPTYSASDESILYAGTNRQSPYRNVQGYLVGAKRATPPYNSTIWREFTLSIPISAFPRGSYSFYPYFEVLRVSDGRLVRWQAHELCDLHSSAF
jgi:hypothetical protein